MKLNSLRVIAAQKELLYKPGGSGEKPARTWQARKEPMKKVSTSEKPGTHKMNTRKKTDQSKSTGANGGTRGARFGNSLPCVLGCAPQTTKKDFPTQSLFYCGKFLAAPEEKRIDMLSKIKNPCYICLGPKSVHRHESGGCFLTYPCRYCQKAHSPLICREKTKEEKKQIDNKAVDPMKKNEDSTDGSTPLETVKKVVDRGACALISSELTETAQQFGHELYEGRCNSQAATAVVTMEDGTPLLTQFDNGSRPSLILAKTAEELNLPVLREDIMNLKTLTGVQRVKTKIYKLRLKDTRGNIRTIKVKSVDDLGGNTFFPKNLRDRFSRFWGLRSADIADPEGELQLILGQELASLAPERVREFVPPTNSPQTCLLRSMLVPEFILYGTCGLDKEIMEETVKSAIDLERFLQAESNVKIGNKCSECESTSCTKCKYETSQLSIVQQAELDEIESSIEVLDNPENGKKMFICQYVWEPGVDLYQKFHRKDSNYQQVKKSTVALRRRLETMNKFDEFNELIQKERENGFLVQVDENLDYFLSSLPDNYNRINLVFKASSTTTPIRVVNANNTKNRYGVSINDVQVKGRTSINSTNKVLWHFQMNPVPLLLDVRKMYRQVRTKTLTNCLRKFLWFDSEGEVITLLPTRMLFGDRQPDKVVEILMRRILAAEAESDFGLVGQLVAKILRHHRYLDDTDTSLRDRAEKDNVVRVIQSLFLRYSFTAKFFISSKEYLTEEEWDQLTESSEDHSEQILGVIYNYEFDTVRPAMSWNPHKKSRGRYTGPWLNEVDIDELQVTKRLTARLLMQQYDATGRFLSISIIRGKILYSRICKAAVGWDELLPEPHRTEALCYFKEMARMMPTADQEGLLPAPRAMIKLNSTLNALVGVRDGGAHAYGAQIYMVSRDETGALYSRLAGAKSRVSCHSMNDNEHLSCTLLMSLMREMFAELDELQRGPLRVISAGDSQSIAFTFSPTRVEKSVLPRNARNETLRAARRILSFNRQANISFCFIPGIENSADLSSKEHSNLLQKSNSSFFREGHPSYVHPTFGEKDRFYHMEWKDGEIKETYTSLRAPEPLPEEETEVVMKQDEESTENWEFYNSIFKKFETFSACLKALTVAKKMMIKKSFKANQSPMVAKFSFNTNLIKRELWKSILMASQAKYPAAKVKYMQPVKKDGVIVTRNRMGSERHSAYFGNTFLPIISPEDKEFVRLLIESAHVVKAVPQPGETAEAPTGTIHLSQYLTRVKLKTGPAGVHIANSRALVRRRATTCTVCLKDEARGGDTLEGDKFLLKKWTRNQGVWSVVNNDIIGPYLWSPSYNLRNKSPNKAWVLVTVDALTGATSFQLMPDYSTNGYLLALKTHIARTRTPAIIVIDAGTQMRAAARRQEGGTKEVEEGEKGSLEITKLQKIFSDTEFIVSPTEGMWYNSVAESAIKVGKKMIRTFYGRIKKAKIPATGIFAFTNLLEIVADQLNSRPIFKSTLPAGEEWMITINDIIKPYIGIQTTNIVKLDEAIQDRYKEFCSIFEEEQVLSGVPTRKSTTRESTLAAGDFVMVKFPSKVAGVYKYGVVQGPVPGSKHRYQVKILTRRLKNGSGKVGIENLPIQNLVLLKPSDISPNQTITMENDVPAPKEDVTYPAPGQCLTGGGMAKRRKKQAGKTPANKRRDERRKTVRDDDLKGKILARKTTYFNEVAATGEDFRRVLKDNARLSDGVLDMFGAILQEKYPKIIYVTCYIMMKINFDPEKAASKVAANPKCRDFFEKEKILFPVHIGRGGQAHWLCLVLDVKKGILREFNSCDTHLRQEIEAVKRRIKLFLISLHRKMKEHKVENGWYNPPTFEEESVKCTQQPPGSQNCGVWLCAYLLACCETSNNEKEDLQIREDAMADIRKEISLIVHRGYI